LILGGDVLRVIKHTQIPETIEDMPILRRVKYPNARKRASVAPALLLENQLGRLFLRGLRGC
jgi:hypothetical protein